MEQWKNWQKLPDDMTNLSNWVLWQKRTDERGKASKLPYQIDGAMARTNDPTTWTDFATAATYASADSTDYNGIGFVLADSGIVCIDLDSCVNLIDGRASTEAAHIVEAMKSYTEISQSGKGLHIFGRVNADTIARVGNGRRTATIEVYAGRHYIATTGNVYRGYGHLRDISRPLAYLLDAEFSATEKPAVIQSEPPAKALSMATICKEPLTAQDKALIAKARAHRLTGREFAMLFDGGNLSADGNNHSRADWHLTRLLAYWTNGDSRAMIRIFCHSALARNSKGLRQRLDYIPRTVGKYLRTAWKGQGYHAHA